MWVAAFIIGVMAAHVPAKDIACSATVLTESWNLLALAHYGQSVYEHAAFIVRDDDGQLRLRVWKFDRLFLTAHYRGPIPSDAVAITHTHPNPLPMPSEGDACLAKKSGLPVYVLTRTMISVTDGRHTRVVLRGDWRPVQSANQVIGGCDTTAAK
jgi:JAB domain-containing protein similar to deubiquitination enzymes